jgi:hypothetical protein
MQPSPLPQLLEALLPLSLLQQVTRPPLLQVLQGSLQLRLELLQLLQLLQRVAYLQMLRH